MTEEQVREIVLDVITGSPGTVKPTMTRQEVREKLHLSEEALKKLIHRGRIKPIRKRMRPSLFWARDVQNLLK